VISLDRATWYGLRSCVKRLRHAQYSAAIDFQGLYKSAVLGWLSGAKERIGFDAASAREPGASRFYTKRIAPRGAHVIEHNLSLAEAAGAALVPISSAQFPMSVSPEAEAVVEKQLAARGVRDFFLLSPGGGWVSKCWPAERYGHLHRRLLERREFSGWRGVINFGPGERKLAEAVRLVAGEPEPVLLSLDLPQLVALTRRAKFFVGADSGPLHVAVAFGVPVIGLFGPTDPARNGPCRAEDIVVRNARPDETTYHREDVPHPSMLNISVEQVLSAVEQRMGLNE
jgi:ADP-heptose:LPS heptosyltransferase